MSTLYKLAQDYEELLQLLYDDEQDEQTIIDTLDAVEAAIEDKCNSVAIVMRELETDIDGLDKEIKRLQARKQVLSNRRERLRDYIAQTMQAVGVKKLQTQLFSFGIRKAGARSLVLTVEADALPSEFQKVTIEPNKAAIKDAMKAAGADEIAGVGYLAPASEFLSIK